MEETARIPKAKHIKWQRMVNETDREIDRERNKKKIESGNGKTKNANK